jgi:hypothetical protein
VESTNSHSSNFTSDITPIRAERRLALAAYRANAYVEVRLRCPKPGEAGARWVRPPSPGAGGCSCCGSRPPALPRCSLGAGRLPSAPAPRLRVRRGRQLLLLCMGMSSQRLASAFPRCRRRGRRFARRWTGAARPNGGSATTNTPARRVQP